MDFNRTVTDPNGCTTDFGAATAKICMEQGPSDTYASSIPGLGMTTPVSENTQTVDNTFTV